MATPHNQLQSIPRIHDTVTSLLALFDALVPLTHVTGAAVFAADYPEAELALRLWCSTRRDAFLSESEGDGMRWVSARRADDSEIVCVIEEKQP